MLNFFVTQNLVVCTEVYKKVIANSHVSQTIPKGKGFQKNISSTDPSGDSLESISNVEIRLPGFHRVVFMMAH